MGLTFQNIMPVDNPTVAIQQLWKTKKAHENRLSELERLYDKEVKISRLLDAIDAKVEASKVDLGIISATTPLEYISSLHQFKLDYSTTNFKLTGNNLDTIQDITSASSMILAGLTLTGFAGAVSATAGVLAAGTLSVAYGGTGTTTLTGVLTGNGTSAISASTGTQNYVMKWGASNAVGSSLLYDTGSGVVIGNTTAASLFELYSSTASPILTITGAHDTDYDPTITWRYGATPASKWHALVDATNNTWLVKNEVATTYSYFTVTATAASVTASATNRVFVITGNAGSFPAGFWAAITDAGALDVRVYDSTNTVEYDRVIYGYVASTSIEIYFVVPTTTATTAFTVTIRVGETPAANDALPANYKALWPMGNVSDISANANTLTNVSSTPFEAGKLGNAAHFDGTADNLYTDVLTPFATMTSGTISWWEYADLDNGLTEYTLQFTKAASANTQVGPFTRFADTVSPQIDSPAAQWYVDATQNWHFTLGDNWYDGKVGTWIHFVLIHDGVAPILCANGVSQALSWVTTTNKTKWLKAAITDATAKADRLTLGGRYTGGTFNTGFDGLIDNVQIVDEVWTTNDALMAYNNESSQSTFWTCGALTVGGAVTSLKLKGTSLGGVGLPDETAPVSLWEVYSNSAHPILTITGANATDYDPQIRFRTDGTPTVKYSFGVDATDDTLRLFHGTGVATDTGLNMNTSGLFGLGAAVNTAARLNIAAGTTTVAPLKFTSGTSLTSAVAGCMEFTTDDLYFTITTGAARKGVILSDGSNLTSGKLAVATTNGRVVSATVAESSGALSAITTISMSGQLTNTLAIGTSPFAVTSTTVNTNLNADLWDGYQFADYLDQAVKQASSPTLAGLTLTGFAGILYGAAGVVAAMAAGTQNYIPKYNNAAGTTIGDSLLYDTGAGIVIGTTTAASLLEVYSAAAHPVITITGAHATDYDPTIAFRTDASPTEKWALLCDATDDRFLFRMTGSSTVGAINTTGGLVWYGTATGTSIGIFTNTPNPFTSTAANVFGLTGTAAYNPSGASSYGAFGMLFNTTKQGSNNCAINMGMSTYADMASGSAGTVIDFGGARISMTSSGSTATGTRAYGLNIYGLLYGGSRLTYTNRAGIRIADLSGLFNATTAYDILIEAKTGAGTVTNDWCIYSDHAAASRLVHNLQFDTDSYGVVLGAEQDSKIYYDGTDLLIYANVAGTGSVKFKDSSIFIEVIKSGADQATAGAAAGELYVTSGHASLPDNVVMRGI